jgi:hypothetical protein
MAARRPARRRPGQPAYRARSRVPSGLRWSCAVIFLVGMLLIGIGSWALLRGAGRVAGAVGSSGAIVFGALLVVFAALLPWLGDGPVRIGPLVVRLRIRSHPPPARRRRRGHHP